MVEETWYTGWHHQHNYVISGEYLEVTMAALGILGNSVVKYDKLQFIQESGVRSGRTLSVTWKDNYSWKYDYALDKGDIPPRFNIGIGTVQRKG